MIFQSHFISMAVYAALVAVVLALIGGLCALLLRSHVAGADNAETRSDVAATVAEP